MTDRHAVEGDIFVGTENSTRGRARVASYYKDNCASPEYSEYSVGAAITVGDYGMEEGGQLFNYRTYGGANIEDAGRQITVHAEQMALFKAIMDGFDEIRAVCVVTSGDDNPIPCGYCRQLLAEWGEPDTKVVAAKELVDNNYEYKKRELEEIIPEAFRSDF